MGQAKRRGTYAERLQAVKARIEGLKPEKIVCNHCNQEIVDIVTLNTKGMLDIEAAFGGLCPQCKRVTYAIKGSSAAVAMLMAAMEVDPSNVGVILKHSNEG